MSERCSSRERARHISTAPASALIFEAATHLGVPLYIRPTMPPRKLIDIAYSGFDEMTVLCCPPEGGDGTQKPAWQLCA